MRYNGETIEETKARLLSYGLSEEAQNHVNALTEDSNLYLKACTSAEAVEDCVEFINDMCGVYNDGEW